MTLSRRPVSLCATSTHSLRLFSPSARVTFSPSLPLCAIDFSPSSLVFQTASATLNSLLTSQLSSLACARVAHRQRFACAAALNGLSRACCFVVSAVLSWPSFPQLVLFYFVAHYYASMVKQHGSFSFSVWFLLLLLLFFIIIFLLLLSVDFNQDLLR